MSVSNSMLRRMIPVIIGVAFLFCAQIANADGHAPTPRPTRLPTALPGGMMPTWMTPPAAGPTQADAGAVLYYYRCMACHGDRGQGLTLEWRAQWDVEHQNCASSACHGSRPPPEGFSFPKNFAPAIVGANTLVKYENAQALFDFISTRMPFQSPGALTRDEYWQLVAYLLKQRGVLVGHVDETNARSILLEEQPLNPAVYLGAAGVLTGAVVLGGIVILRMRKK